MLTITCTGTPYEIGQTHGSHCISQIASSIAFYTTYFQKKAKLDWTATRQHASRFTSFLHEQFPEYEEEMRGVADGAGVDYEDILAINVRTEISFGLFNDGCTAMAWKTAAGSYLGQNWDWQEAQKPNLMVLNISQPGTGKPDISMVTEAGIIGKIGLNSAGLGVTLNAIRCPGVSYTKLPIHLSLRLILESRSVSSALSKLSETGCAASAHMLIADPTTSVGLEATHKTLLQLKPDSYGRVLHTNHLLLEHEGVVDTVWLKDSITRLARIGELTDGMIGKEGVGVEEMRSVFLDECGAPAAINRKEVEGVCESSTIFNIWMDLGRRVAEVRVGRPTEGGEVLVLRPEVVPN